MASVVKLEMGDGSHEQITIMKPLMEGNRSSFDDSHGNKLGGKAGKGSRKNQSMRMVYLSTLVAVCGSYEIGAMYSVFGSILNIGAMVGAVTSGKIADFVGRKWAMSIYSIFCIVGWLTISSAQGALSLDIGWLAGGYGIGAFFYVVPVYIAEISPTHSRGELIAFHQVLLCTGLGVTFIIGISLPWRGLALAGVIPCAIQILGLPFIPESPRWLIISDKL